MSTHALACRRTDLTEFLTILFEVLAPLFAFLSEERWTSAKVAPVPAAGPVPPASSISTPAVTAITPAAGTTPVIEPASGIISSPAPSPVVTVVEVPAVSNGPTAAVGMPAVEIPAADTRTEVPEPVTVPGTTQQPEPTPKEAKSPALFVKISGRYRPAPTNPVGPLFRREAKGKRTRFVRA